MFGIKKRQAEREAKVLAVLRDGNVHYGLDISYKAGLRADSLYPTLARLEARGIIASDWEKKKYGPEPKHRRRMYWLRTPG